MGAVQKDSSLFMGNGRQVFVRSHAEFPTRGDVVVEGRKIAWAISVGHADGAGGVTDVQFSAWALRTDQLVPAARILLCNASGPVHAVTVEVRRLDVMRALSITAGPNDPVAYCGFRDTFATKEDRLNIVIEVDGIRVPVGEVSFPPPGVVSGSDGWLFLAGDTNDSIAQHCTDWRPADAWIRQWQTYFSEIPTIPAGKVAFLVAPAKEAVMPERHPVPVRARTAITHLLSSFPKQIIYPVEELRKDRDFSYDRTDTHWTDYGGRRACEVVFAHLGEAPPDLPALYEVAQMRGDLGDKLVPIETDRRLCAAWPNAAKLVFDNFVLHHSNIRIHSNAEALRQQTVVIFGDSFSDQMVPYLSAIFSRTISIYGSGAWDPAIIAHEQPHLVILQSNDRFLVTPRAARFDCQANARKKIAQGHVTGGGDRTEALRRFSALGEDWYVERYSALADRGR